MNTTKTAMLDDMIRSEQAQVIFFQKRVVTAKIDLDFAPDGENYQFSLKWNIKELAKHLNRVAVLSAEREKAKDRAWTDNGFFHAPKGFHPGCCAGCTTNEAKHGLLIGK
jgi:hypothetical protein